MAFMIVIKTLLNYKPIEKKRKHSRLYNFSEVDETKKMLKQNVEPRKI